jgi:hypothetical protein
MEMWYTVNPYEISLKPYEISLKPYGNVLSSCGLRLPV